MHVQWTLTINKKLARRLGRWQPWEISTVCLLPTPTRGPDIVVTNRLPAHSYYLLRVSSALFGEYAAQSRWHKVSCTIERSDCPWQSYILPYTTIKNVSRACTKGSDSKEKTSASAGAMAALGNKHCLFTSHPNKGPRCCGDKQAPRAFLLRNSPSFWLVSTHIQHQAVGTRPRARLNIRIAPEMI